MEDWLLAHWLDLIQSLGIVAGLLLTAYTTRKDEQARRIGNLIAIHSLHRELWAELNERPGLARVLEATADLDARPVTVSEELFVTSLILHLSTVFRALTQGEFVKLEGLLRDVRAFFSLPIPLAVWKTMKSFQDADFTAFVELTMDAR